LAVELASLACLLMELVGPTKMAPRAVSASSTPRGNRAMGSAVVKVKPSSPSPPPPL